MNSRNRADLKGCRMSCRDLLLNCKNLLTLCREKKSELEIRSSWHTREIPWLTFVEVDFWYRMWFEVSTSQLACEIVRHKLFVGGVETETWWQPIWFSDLLSILSTCCSAGGVVYTRHADRHMKKKFVMLKQLSLFSTTTPAVQHKKIQSVDQLSACMWKFARKFDLRNWTKAHVKIQTSF